MRQPCAGSLQVTLHAHLELPFGREPRGVHNRVANRLFVPALHRLNMAEAGAVASLAVNAFGDAAGEPGFAAKTVAARRNLRVGIVTEDTFLGDLTAEIVMV